MRSSKRNSTAAPPPARGPGKTRAPGGMVTRRRVTMEPCSAAWSRKRGHATRAARRCSAVSLVCGALALLLAGCEAGPPPEAAQRDVVRPNLRLAVDVPDGWSWKPLGGDIVLEMMPDAPAADADTDTNEPAEANAVPRRRVKRRPVIHVAMIEREGLGLDAWADQAVAATAELEPGLEVLARKPVTLAGDRPALALVLKNPQGVEPFVQHMRLVLTESRAYAVIATAPERTWGEVEPAAAACFESFLVW